MRIRGLWANFRPCLQVKPAFKDPNKDGKGMWKDVQDSIIMFVIDFNHFIFISIDRLVV